jgi:serine/threonine protein kinase
MTRTKTLTKERARETSALTPNRRTLADLMERGPVEREEALAILHEAARSLDALHTEGRAHGALCPSAVLLKEDSSIESIADNGDLHELADATAYLSPEQVGGAQGSPQGDQFALGLIAYELITGDSLRGEIDLVEWLFLVRYGMADLSNQESLDFAMQPIFDRVLAVDPAHRFESCQAFAESLERIPRRTYSETRLLEADQVLDSLRLENTVLKPGSNRAWWIAAGIACLLAFSLGFANWRAQQSIEALARQRAQQVRSLGSAELENGKLEVCNVSGEPLHIREVAAAYMDSGRHMKVFNSSSNVNDGWEIAPQETQALSWHTGSLSDWDGSVLFYFLRMERDRKEFIYAGRWNGATAGCLHVK